MTQQILDPRTTVGSVQLTVRDLERMERFYRETLGFHSHRADGTQTLSADGPHPLLVLKGNPEAPRPPARSTGLYHTAVRVPTRHALARLLAHLLKTGTRLQGASDHGVSEALYLADPEGNGLEFYYDRPRDAWPKSGDEIALITAPLDMESLLGELEGDLEPWTALPAETVIGHVHLRVADLNAAENFYCNIIGFDKVAEIPRQAGFVSAGGYHHHIGYNVWSSAGSPPPPRGSAGLDHFTIVLPDHAALEAVRSRLTAAGAKTESVAEGLLAQDPSGNGVLLTAP